MPAMTLKSKPGMDFKLDRIDSGAQLASFQQHLLE